MSNRALDRQLAHENYVGETACCECGYHRNGAHHPKIVCPKTGRCGECGNDWPCADHAPAEELKQKETVPGTWQKMGKGQHVLFNGRMKLGYVESDDSKWVAAVLAPKIDYAEHRTRRDAMAWVERHVRQTPTTV